MEKDICNNKHKSPKEEANILFIKWDRFSRNVEYAYEMIGMLRKYKTTAMAIDQPVDFSVPESTVMLLLYTFLYQKPKTVGEPKIQLMGFVGLN